MIDPRKNEGQIEFKASVTTGNTTSLVAAQGERKKIRVISYDLVCTAASTADWKSASTSLTGAQSFAANGGVSKQYSPFGHFTTVVNEALQITCGGTGPIVVHGVAVVVREPPDA